MKKELTKTQKRKYLRTHGWFQLWGGDDWLVTERYDRGDYTYPDKQGLSTDKAFKIEMEFGEPEIEKVWGGKETTFKRLKKKVSDIQKKRQSKNE